MLLLVAVWAACLVSAATEPGFQCSSSSSASCASDSDFGGSGGGFEAEVGIAEEGMLDEESDTEAAILKVSLLQSGLAMARASAGAAGSKQRIAVADIVAPPPPQPAIEEAEGASLMQSELLVSKAASGGATAGGAGSRADGAASGYGCMGGATTLQLLTNVEVLRSVGYLSSRPGCSPEEASRSSFEGPPPSDALGAELLGGEAPEISRAAWVSLPLLSSWTQRCQERMVLGGYFALYAASVAYVCYGLHKPWKTSFSKVQFSSGMRKVKTETDIEDETLQRSWIAWLCCSWASQWIARWGHGGASKIKPDDLPQMGGREYQARECAKLFQRLWLDETSKHGEAKASVFRVVVQMWTVKSMLTLMVILGCQMLLHNLYTVVLIEHSMNYFVWLQQQRLAHPEQELPMAGPLLVVILIFSAMPFLNALLSTLSQYIARKLDQRVTGALCVAIFEKAQRLPLSYLQQLAAEQKERATSRERGGANPGGEGEHEGGGEKSQAGGAEGEKELPVDMMQLIGYDIYQSLQGSYFQVCSCGNSLIACVVFAVMLWRRLGHATLVALGVSLLVLFILATICVKLAESYASLAKFTDQRVQAAREMLTGVRVVKCYAWEEAMEARINGLREKELSILETYWRCLGGILGVAILFPRALVISALAAFSAMYGTHSVSNILVCMQILYGLKASCEVLGMSMGRAITIEPSLRRIESFLKLPEAPVLLPEKVPSWVSLWPKSGQPSAEKAPIEEAASERMSLCLRGSFSWTDGGEPTLKDLDLEVQPGELVGLVGRVGSGKSTMLQAILGELYPVTGEDVAEPAWPRLRRPEVIAYCPQVAHIAEGSLKDNVLFGQDLEQQRYAEALAGASLEGDLKMLPGGDMVPIGGRGITLSGGQKARVALARAAYHRGSEVVLIDDPFGAVDAPTATVILDRLLLGPLLADRARIVAMQPDDERLRKFDRVVVIDEGRIQAQGTPEEVLRTEAYRQVLSSRAQNEDDDGAGASPGGVLRLHDGAAGADGDIVSPASDSWRKEEDHRNVRITLREEELEHRPTADMVAQYCQIGRYRNIINTLLLYCVQAIFYMYSDLVLANWTNAIVVDPQNVDDGKFVFAYLFWLGLGAAIWPVLWSLGMSFSLGISKEILGLMLHRIMRAPVDKFFDKHPIGRIMNRMVTDIAAIDFQLYLKATSTVTVGIHTVIPIFYVHFIVPWFFTFLAMPLYILIGTLCMRYWSTTVPFRYCAANARSEVNGIIGEVASSNAVIRAYGAQERITLDMCDAVDNELKADLNGQRVLKRWLINRVVLLWSFYTTSTLLIGLLNTQHLGAGTLGLCLSMLFVVEALIEPNLENATGAQMELISLARIHEYLSIPQEAARWRPEDHRYRSFTARVPRRGLGELFVRGSGASLEVCRVANGRALLRASPCGKALVAVSPTSEAPLRELCPECEELSAAVAWHRIVATGGAVRDAAAMAAELCACSRATEGEPLLLEVQSGWLAGGARVEIEGLTAGYADIPRDVLKGISLRFEPKTKVGVVGTTGCGKSSLLLVLLRILEPRSGRVLLNGVDTSELGLGTLRRALGLVPQDPVLFSGTLRQNLDPLNEYTDERIMAAVGLAQVRELVDTWPEGLGRTIVDEGSNLSFGQRQLFCLARMILRQPALLLLDEATSAIDPKTQEVVQQTITSAFKDSTLIAIAHRLETILDFDYVCVMEKGDVVEKGHPKEVAVRQGGLFNRMLAARKLHQ